MKLPSWSELALSQGVLPEPSPGNDRLILWLPGRDEDGLQHWERISSVASAEITRAGGLCAIPANLIQARQRLRTWLGKLRQLFGTAAQEKTWLLPSGESAEQWGERQEGLLLVWAENGPSLDAGLIQAQWPQSTRVQKLGENLFLVGGMTPASSAVQEPVPPLDQKPSPQQVEQRLARARQQGDRRQEVAALTDLGVITMRQGNARVAVLLLEETLALARQLGDSALQRDVLGSLGLAQLGAGQAPLALPIFQQELAQAQADPFGKKLALDHLGRAFWSLRDYPQAFACYEKALSLARQLKDRQHEAQILWGQAILHAELNQRQQTLDRAQAAVALFQNLHPPQARLLQAYLDKYRAEQASGQPLSLSPGDLDQGLDPTPWGAPSAPPPGLSPESTGPGLLRMAFTALKSLAQFVRSGCQTVSSQVHQQRLEICSGCEHHTGVRCRVCGCFTDTKAWFPHEECPKGKWPA